MKHLIKIESTPHGVLGVRHTGLDNQYCEAGELVILKWQPDAKWGLQEAHYTDGGGNVTPIDLTRVKVDGKDEVVFTMPNDNITIGGTFKMFVSQDWTEGINPSIGDILTLGDNGEPMPKSVNDVADEIINGDNKIVEELYDDGFSIIPFQFKDNVVISSQEKLSTNSSGILQYIAVTKGDVVKITSNVALDVVRYGYFSELQIGESVSNMVQTMFVQDIVLTAEMDGFLGISHTITSLLDICFLKQNKTSKLDALLQQYDVFRGKKYAALGDSITWGYTPHGISGTGDKLRSYAMIAADKLGMNFADYGVSGTNLSGNGASSMDIRFSEMTDEADIITFMGGTNDIRNSVPLGTMADRDTSTFYGGLHVLCEGLYRKYILNSEKDVKVIALTPPKMVSLPAGNANGVGTLYADFDLWAEAVKKVAEYYGIPCLDFYNTGLLATQLAGDVETTAYEHTGFFNPLIPDGVHPSQKGQEVLASVFVGFLKGIM